MMPPRRAPARTPRRGAALLVAMVMLTVVATLASGMVWQQWRAVQVETAERSRTQSAWILAGALDWARLILREQRADWLSLQDTWAQPLAEARLSSFLAVDRDNNADSGPEAFLSGQITDAQSRYNLRNLTDGDPQRRKAELAVLERLCQSAGLPTSLAASIANGLTDAAQARDGNAPLSPSRLEDLTWLGVDVPSIEALRPWVVLLPEEQTQARVNLNTAPREVLAAVIEGIGEGTAERLVQARQRSPFKDLKDAQEQMPAGVALNPARVGVNSQFFEVRGRLRLNDRVLEETSLVFRPSPTEVVVRLRQRVSMVLPTGGN